MKVDRVTIQWPSGTEQELAVPGIDGILTVEEGKAAIQSK
jgi:hypothetical protein